jgi:hypothetical protein
VVKEKGARVNRDALLYPQATEAHTATSGHSFLLPSRRRYRVQQCNTRAQGRNTPCLACLKLHEVIEKGHAQTTRKLRCFSTLSLSTIIIMSSGAEKKQEADFTAEVDALIPTAEGLAKSGKLHDALEQVYTLEKKARNAADLNSTTRLLLLALHLLRTTSSVNSPDWDGLNEAIVSLSRKHGQLKQAITRMVGAAMCYLHAPGVGESGKSEEEKAKEVEMKEVEKEEARTRKEAERAKAAAAIAAKNDGSSSKATEEKKEKMKEAVDGAMEDKGEGKENESIRLMMEQAVSIGNTGVTEAMRLKLVETIRQVTEGKVRKTMFARDENSLMRLFPADLC